MSKQGQTCADGRSTIQVPFVFRSAIQRRRDGHVYAHSHTGRNNQTIDPMSGNSKSGFRISSGYTSTSYLSMQGRAMEQFERRGEHQPPSCAATVLQP